MPKLETTGYKKFWPLKQLVGHNQDGSKKSVEGFRNMKTGEFHAPEKGWNGEPPSLPSGEKKPTSNSNKFSQNYPSIFGHS